MLPSLDVFFLILRINSAQQRSGWNWNWDGGAVRPGRRGGYVLRRAASACSAFSARRVIEASAPSAASARRNAVSKAAGDADAERPDELPEDDPGEPDRDRARSKLSQPPDGSASVSLDLDRDRSEAREPETETARCSIEGDDRADQCSALASPCTESQCVGSLS